MKLNMYVSYYTIFLANVFCQVPAFVSIDEYAIEPHSLT